MVLSDRTIARLLEAERIVIEPYDESLLQPSSVDVCVDRFFRVFHNARYAYIDVKEPQEDLTELVEIDDERPFILHPGEFVLGSTLEPASSGLTSCAPSRTRDTTSSCSFATRPARATCQADPWSAR